MMDLLRQFENLQIEGQKSMTTLCDIETTKKSVLASLTIMESNCYPGGNEEELKDKLNELHLEDEDNNRITKTIRNSYVSTRRRVTSVRNAILESFIDFYIKDSIRNKVI